MIVTSPRFKPLLALTAFFCVVFIARYTNATEPRRLRILSYNIHHAEGIDHKLDLPRIARVIRSVQPDLVALQEVDKEVKRTRSVDQPAEIARLTGMNVVFGANIELQGGHYGNAVLSRFPISRHTNHLLPNFASGEQRGVIAAEIHVPFLTKSLLFLATHFDHRPDQRERVASAKAINKLAERRSEQSALLAGDMNDVANSEPLRQLRTEWQVSNKEPLPTIPVAAPQRQIDFILYRPVSRWKVIETKVLDEAIASDHRAVFAILEILRVADG